MYKKDITEYEAKFYPVDKIEFRKKLESIGAKLAIPERKMVRLIADSRLNRVLSKNHYIRVRDEGNIVRLSFKITANQSGKLTDQKEIDIDVSDFDKTVKIFELIGFKFGYKQETLREEWVYKGAQITIDTWPGLEPYSEIETGSEQEVKLIAKKLGFEWNKKIITAAAEVYQRVYKLEIDKVLDMISNISFNDNPFDGLKKYELEYN